VDRVVHAYEYRKYFSRRALYRARTYDTWAAAAAALDRVHSKDAWKAQPESPFYDAGLIRHVARTLRRQVAEGRAAEVAQLLLTACKNNLGGVENERLYAHTYLGTKRVVQDYVEQGTSARPRWLGRDAP
jgi:hypothetical protein